MKQRKEFTCSTEPTRFSDIGQQWEKAIWFKREDHRALTQERIMLFLGSRFSFISIYKNGYCLKSAVDLDGDHITEIMVDCTSIADVFEYCRKRFCRDLSPVKGTKHEDLNQLDMFEVM